MKRSRPPVQRPQDPGKVPWQTFHALVHETRSPLTVVAYASEILLAPGRPLSSQAARRHLGSILHACHEASAHLTLLSRWIEVEQAGQGTVADPFPVGAFRDPDARVAGPAIEATAVAHLDLRLAGNLAMTLWELASLLPGTRPTLTSVEFDSRQLRLHFLAPALLGRLLTETTMPTRRDRRGVAKAGYSPPIGLRAHLIRRCLALLGGSVESVPPGQDTGNLLVQIPVNAPSPTPGRKPSKPSSNPCK